MLHFRHDISDPMHFKNQFPETLIKEFIEELGYYHEAISNIDLLLNSPTLVKADEREIKENFQPLDVSMAYIYTESLIAVQKLASAQQASFKLIDNDRSFKHIPYFKYNLPAKFIFRLNHQSFILNSSGSRSRLAMTVTKQAWFDLNVLTGEVLTSPEYAKLLGYEPAEFQSDFKGWQDGLHPDDHDAVMAAYQNGLSRGSVFSADYRRCTKNETWPWFSSTAKIIEWDLSERALRVIGIHTDITERKQAEQKIKHMAHYDLLTNRVLLAGRLSQDMLQCQRSKQSLAIAYLVLDGFKIINDTHGYDVGDKFLTIVSQRMRAVLRINDTLAAL